MSTSFQIKNEAVQLSCRASPDRLKLFIDALPTPEKSTDITAQMLRDLLEQKLPSDLLDDRVLEDIAAVLHRGEPVKERRVAKGVEPVSGRDGRLVILVKKFGSSAEIRADETGGRSLRDVFLFDNITAGQAVARVYPPKPGVPGRDVFGKVIAAQAGKAATVSLDKTLLRAASESEYDSIIAQIPGALVESSGQMMIKDELRIEGNVDYHTGSIQFIGSLTVTGDVLPGFMVQGRKGVTVRGTVQRGSLRSAEGPVTVLGACFGGELSSIAAFGDVTLRECREADIESTGVITVKREAVESQLRSPRAVRADEARIVGGSLVSAEGVQARELGNDLGKETSITLSLAVETKHEFVLLMKQIGEHQKAQHVLELHLGPYALDPGSVKRLAAEHRRKIEGLLDKLTKVRESKLALLAEKKRLLAGAAADSERFVNVLQHAFRGVHIQCAEAWYSVHDTLRGPMGIRFDTESEEFVTGELVPIPTPQPIEPAKSKKETPKKK